MVDPKLKHIMNIVAEEYSLSPYQVELMFESQFKFAKEIMAKKEGESIMFRVIGKFLVDKRRLDYMREHEQNRNS